MIALGASAAFAGGPTAPHGGSVVFQVPGGTYSVKSGRKDNEVVLGYDAHDQALVVTDSQGIEGRSELCVSVSEQEVRCDMPPDAFGVQVGTGAGDDRVDVRASFPVRATLDGQGGNDRLRVSRSFRPIANLYGENGDDTLAGGAGEDYVDGSSGADRLHGYGGGDLLRGGAGADEFSAGAGPDHMDAVNDDSDRTITCGRGRDSVHLDADRDPDPVRCERVTRK
jgi:Ca2+-binding RTX toxin-like protein